MMLAFCNLNSVKPGIAFRAYHQLCRDEENLNESPFLDFGGELLKEVQYMIFKVNTGILI
jgi:hypothetical protein